MSNCSTQSLRNYSNCKKSGQMDVQISAVSWSIFEIKWSRQVSKMPRTRFFVWFSDKWDLPFRNFQNPDLSGYQTLTVEIYTKLGLIRMYQNQFSQGPFIHDVTQVGKRVCHFFDTMYEGLSKTVFLRDRGGKGGQKIYKFG